MSAVAGYECLMQLSHQDNLNKVIAEKVIAIDKGQIKSGSFGTLFIEKSMRHSSLEVNAFINGRNGEEDASFEIYRRHQKNLSSFGERITVHGTGESNRWFDSYKLGINCSLKS